ncbi:hypothetical protein B0H11DRAFT_2247897 [Mycena galericulata]|nr:hypothetical protein B0H11DRAFT_2247897 [Mycena galericulata]
MSPTPTTAPIHEVLGTAEADLAAAQRGQHNPDDQVFIEAEYYARAGVPPHQQNSSGRRDALPVPPQKLPAATARVRCLHSNCVRFISSRGANQAIENLARRPIRLSTSAGCNTGAFTPSELVCLSSTLFISARVLTASDQHLDVSLPSSLSTSAGCNTGAFTPSELVCLSSTLFISARVLTASDQHLDVPLQTLSPGSGKRPPPAQAVVCCSTFSLMRTSACGTHADHLAPTCLDFRAIRTGGCLSSTLFISARVLTASDQHLDVPLQTLSPGSGKRPPPAQAVVCRSTFSLMRTSACGTHADHLAPTCLDFRAIRTGGCLSSTLFISARVLTASDQHLGVLLMRICDTPWCSTPLRVANLIRCALLTHWIIADLLPPECVQSLRANEIWAIIKTFGYCWGSRTNSTNSKKRHRPLEQNSRDLQASGYIQEVMFSHSEEKLWVCRQSPIVSRLPSLNATIGGISGSETVLEDVDFGPTRTALTVRTLFAEFYRQPTLPLK